MNTSHEQGQEDRILALEAGQKQILELLKPIAETYSAANLMGKWVMAFLVLISILLGILLSIKKIWPN